MSMNMNPTSVNVTPASAKVTPTSVQETDSFVELIHRLELTKPKLSGGSFPKLPEIQVGFISTHTGADIHAGQQTFARYFSRMSGTFFML